MWPKPVTITCTMRQRSEDANLVWGTLMISVFITRVYGQFGTRTVRYVYNQNLHQYMLHTEGPVTRTWSGVKENILITDMLLYQISTV